MQALFCRYNYLCVSGIFHIANPAHLRYLSANANMITAMENEIDGQPFSRREHDRITVDFDVVDDESPNKLTLSEIKELKRLARMSKTARAFTALMIGVASLFGIPALLEFVGKHWK